MTATKSNTTGYIYEIHVIRAIACLLILMVHVTGNFYYLNQQEHHWLPFFFNQLSRFGTPLFAMISGFLLFYQVKRKEFELQPFLQSRISKIVLPYLFWTFFYLGIVWLTTDTYIFVNLKHFFTYYIYFGDAFYHLWFMSVVIQFYILFPFVQRWLRTFHAWMIGLLISLAISLFFQVFYRSSMVPDYGYLLADRAFMPLWLFYFIAGGCLAYYWIPIRDWVRQTKVRLTLIVITLLIGIEAYIEYQWLGSIPSERVINLIAIPLLSLTIIAVFPTIQRMTRLYRLLVQVGKFSMGIYLLHPFFIYFGVLLPPWFWNPWMVLVTYTLFFTLCMASVHFIQRIPYHQYLIPIPKIKKGKNKRI